MVNQLRDDLHTVDKDTYKYIVELNVTIIPSSNPGLVRANVYRPKTNEKVPVLVTYGPYGKDIHYSVFFPKPFSELNPKMRSEHSAFETPDPGYWTAQGYAVVRADEIGTGQSPGLLDVFSKSTYEVFKDVIEWAAEQPWSSGKVATVGISYYAASQWRVAALRPKGLACIIPTDGQSDYYRDRCRHGGIFTGDFLDWWWFRQVVSNQYGRPGRAASNWGPDTIEGDLDETTLAENRCEHIEENAVNQFRDTEYHRTREFNVEDIEVPILSVGNWGSYSVHLRGNVLGWQYATSKLKFLRMITGRHDLPFYSDTEAEISKSFLDAFCKDDDYAGWTKGEKPPVDLIIRHSGVPHDNQEAEERAFKRRAEPEWPIARTQYTRYYLTADKSLTKDEPPSVSSKLSYPAMGTVDDPKGTLFMTKPFPSDIEITGHLVAHLYVSLTPDFGGPVAEDIQVFVTVRHYKADGIENFYTGITGEPVPLAKGWLKVSLRKVNKEHARHREYLPYRDYFSNDVLPVLPGEVYPIDVEIWPTSVALRPGEQLGLEVSSGDTQGVGLFAHSSSERVYEKLGGTNNIHFGPSRSNWLLLPIIPSA